ncbi:MAG: sigma-70 family RNA polymerase sigma factor [Coprothermobacterota bacterium]|nr:sigma-70 family RNA polymerase sigma factor [Coprothermobacterota bacterium]
MEELYLLYRPALYRYALHICANKEEAEDLVQETFRRIIPHEETLQGKGKQVFSYLRSTLRHIFIDQLRSLKDWTYILLDEENPGSSFNFKESLESDEIFDRLALDEALERLEEFLKELPQFAQTVLYFRFTCGFSMEKTARILGCSRRKVRETTISSLQYLKEKLKNCGLEMEEENVF